MCPDSQVLSVYFDGELPDPWRKQMEAHLAVCSRCQEKIAVYCRIRDAGSGETGAPGTGDAGERARERVWQRLSTAMPAAARKTRQAGSSALWRRSVAVPLPIAAAAALAVAVLTLALFRGTGAKLPGNVPEAALAGDISLDFPGIVPAADMNGVLQYLGSEESADFVIIRLPENRNFASVGQPTIIKAAEYARRNSAP